MHRRKKRIHKWRNEYQCQNAMVPLNVYPKRTVVSRCSVMPCNLEGSSEGSERRFCDKRSSETWFIAFVVVEKISSGFCSPSLVIEY